MEEEGGGGKGRGREGKKKKKKRGEVAMGEDLDSSEPKIFLVISHHLTSVFKTVIRFQFFSY